MDAPISIGVIGAGYAAEQLHWPAFRRFSGLRVRSVSDLDRSRAEKLASQLPGASVAADAAAVIADSGVEAVVILTPPGTHGSLIASALDAAKHVFVEKPLTSIADELEWLVEKTRASNRIVAVGHNLRCHRFVRHARALIQQGALGELIAIRAVWMCPARTARKTRQDTGLGGSVLLDLGVHHVDLFAYLDGSPIENIGATVNAAENGSEKAALAGRLRSGTLFTSIVCTQGVAEHSIHVTGTKGAIEFSCYRANSWRATSNRDIGLRSQTSEIRQYLRQLPDVVNALRTGGDWLQSYEAQWRAFVRSVRQESPVVCSVEDAAAAVKICAQLACTALQQTA